MRILITICLVILLVDVAGLVWSVADEKPNEAFTALSVAAPQPTRDPKTNSYFLMVGFGSPGTANALQLGYQMWLEADQGDRYFDYAKDSRAASRLETETLQAIEGWRIPEVLKTGAAPSSQDANQEALQARYAEWLAMPFEDRGYGLRGTMRMAEIFAAHRRYIAGSKADDPAALIERLEKDMAAWRSVMAEARTLGMQLLGAAAVEDDTIVLSELLKRNDLPKQALQRLSVLARPLNYFEQSIRLPMQNEFVLGVRRYTHPQAQDPAARDEHRENLRWLAAVNRINPRTLDRVALTPPDSRTLRFLVQKQRTLNLYARYYDAMIKVSDKVDGPMPKLADFVRSTPRSYLDHVLAPVLSPVDNIVNAGEEPSWEPFIARIREIDARLRLAGLQVMLRTPTPQPVQFRVAQAGTAFYDPFSGITMLWSTEKGLLYSVGRDGLDDGGDSQLDITVAPLVQTDSAPVSAARAKVRATH